MRQEVYDAITASTLSEASRRKAVAYFAARYPYEEHRGPIPAEILAAVIADAAAAEATAVADPKAILQRALDVCFFGTLQPREGSERLAHAKDGWRDGQSHPFAVLVEGKPKTYDILMRPGPNGAYDAERTRDLYRVLSASIEQGKVTAAP